MNRNGKAIQEVEVAANLLLTRTANILRAAERLVERIQETYSDCPRSVNMLAAELREQLENG